MCRRSRHCCFRTKYGAVLTRTGDWGLSRSPQFRGTVRSDLMLPAGITTGSPRPHPYLLGRADIKATRFPAATYLCPCRYPSSGTFWHSKKQRFLTKSASSFHFQSIIHHGRSSGEPRSGQGAGSGTLLPLWFQRHL